MVQKYESSNIIRSVRVRRIGIQMVPPNPDK